MSIRYENSGLPVILQDPFVNGSAAIANNAAALGSGTYDNSTGERLYFWATAELITNFGAAAVALLNSSIELYLVPSPSGASRYASVDFTSIAPPPTIALNHYKGSFNVALSGVGQTNVMMIEGIPLSPHLQRAYIVNRTGQTMSAGWQLNLYPYREQ